MAIAVCSVAVTSLRPTGRPWPAVRVTCKPAFWASMPWPASVRVPMRTSLPRRNVPDHPSRPMPCPAWRGCIPVTKRRSIVVSSPTAVPRLGHSVGSGCCGLAFSSGFRSRLVVGSVCRQCDYRSLNTTYCKKIRRQAVVFIKDPCVCRQAVDRNHKSSAKSRLQVRSVTRPGHWALS